MCVPRTTSLTPHHLFINFQEIHVTPRPEALRCFFHMAFPRALRLDRFHLRGSFADITGPRSAPVVTCDVRSLATQVRSCRIEAQSLRIALPSWRQDRPPRGVDLLRALTGPGAIWEECVDRVGGGGIIFDLGGRPRCCAMLSSVQEFLPLNDQIHR